MACLSTCLSIFPEIPIPNKFQKELNHVEIGKDSFSLLLLFCLLLWTKRSWPQHQEFTVTPDIFDSLTIQTTLIIQENLRSKCCIHLYPVPYKYQKSSSGFGFGVVNESSSCSSFNEIILQFVCCTYGLRQREVSDSEFCWKFMNITNEGLCHCG